MSKPDWKKDRKAIAEAKRHIPDVTFEPPQEAGDYSLSFERQFPMLQEEHAPRYAS